MARTATCRCGESAIDVEGEPILNLICHCSSCRRRTGAPCGWTATFHRSRITARRGAFQTYRSDGNAGPVVNSFCSTCGTTLLMEPSAFPELIGCAGGCFAESPLPEPTLSTSDDLRCAWLTLPEGWTKRTSEDAARSAPPR